MPASRDIVPVADRPRRLALQTGRLDDDRRHITPDDDLWRSAYELFVEQGQIEGVEHGAAHEAHIEALRAAWPAYEGDADGAQALAVAVALAEPFASRERILGALAAPGRDQAALERLIARVPAIANSRDASRPRFPHLYDPDVAAPTPIDAIVDGPRSQMVAEHLNTIKQRDRNLADAIVLGADLEILDLLEELGLAARRAGRSELAGMFEHDRRHWQTRADAARARQRLEGLHYHWRCDNVPPECMEAAHAEAYHNVDVLLHPPPTTG
jgi:hypothetical protein